MFRKMNIRSFLFIFLPILIGVLIGLSLIYVWKFKKNYVAIFFNNGAIYFGQLSTFPQLKLEKAIFPVIDQNGNITSFQRFSGAFWQPKGPLYPNKESILFIAPIKKDSPIIELIEGRPLQAQPTVPTPSPSPIPTPTATQTPNQQP